MRFTASCIPGFFKFLSKIYQQQLQLYVGQNGRANNFLHFGRKKSKFIGGEIVFNNDFYDDKGNLKYAKGMSINISRIFFTYLKDGQEWKLKKATLVD